ncbi:MAG: hypothetical protein K9M81_05205 [Chthoniobacterales bacterium]|nr:hypothetical protein [Chthoniobacterales bacterium]
MNRALLSLRRLTILALMTFRELLHQQVSILLAILFLFFLALSWLFLHFSFQERAFLFEKMNVGLFSLFLSLLAIVASAPLLILNGEEVMILSRELPRFEYFLGRFFGIFLLLVTATGGFGILLLQSLWKNNGNTMVFFLMLMAAFMKAILLAGMTFLISTVASSSLFTIMSTIIIYFIGHLEKTAQSLFANLNVFHAWLPGTIAVLATLVPDFSFFNASEIKTTTLLDNSTYVFTMLQLGMIYLGIYLLMGCFLFQRQGRN